MKFMWWFCAILIAYAWNEKAIKQWANSSVGTDNQWREWNRTTLTRLSLVTT